MPKEIVCPLWEICLDTWRYYNNQKCRMLELIEAGEVSDRAIAHIRHEIQEYLEVKR